MSAEGNSGVACCNCGVGSADDLKGVEVAVAVEEVFERRESEYILLVGSRKPPANEIYFSNFTLVQIQIYETPRVFNCNDNSMRGKANSAGNYPYCMSQTSK